MTTHATLSETIGDFVARTAHGDIPADVRERTRLLLLDALGAAYAATPFDFAHRALAALSALGGGDSEVIGMRARLGLRDAILMNGLLVHGLDYDDTYLPGSVHLTASCVPTALALAAARQASGADLVTACAVGLEIGARLAAAGRGGFLRAGFHATSVVGVFACTAVAGRLMRMGADQIATAQGIALSTASGNMQPMQDGSWTKGIHPGWAGASAVVAATLAQQGFVGPREAYEGRFGLYPCYLGPHAEGADLESVRQGLGERWEFVRTSIKLYPACHQSHAFFNAATGIAREHGPLPQDIVSIKALVAEPAVPLICEPLDAKRRPDSSYAAQFSLPYGIACCLVRGRFGLAELEERSYSDPALLALAQKMTYEVDPEPGFPKFRSGEVIVEMADGRQLGRREAILPDEPAPERAIVDKFMDNASAVMAPARAARIRDAVLGIETLGDVGELTRLLGDASR